LRGDGGGFGVTLERTIEETARRRKGEEMRVCKQRDSTEEKEIEEQGGLAEKGFGNPKRRKEKSEKTSHNVCSRQLMDDANRLKCSEYQGE